MSRILKALSVLRMMADAQDVHRVLESTRPEFDCTDAAHPCWWRGHDNGARGMEAKLKKEHAREIAELQAELDRRHSVRYDEVITELRDRAWRERVRREDAERQVTELRAHYEAELAVARSL